jgi:antitoxin VapB
MALSIKSDEADRLAREIAGRTGETITEAVVVALRQRLERQHDDRLGIAGRLRRLAEDVAELPVEDRRSPEAIVGYDEHGLPA